jgi:hypothetical protein
MECRPLAESSLIFSSRGKRGAEKGGERRGSVCTLERAKGELNYLGFSLFLAKARLLHLHALSLPFSLKTLRKEARKEGRKEGRMDGWMDECFFFFFSPHLVLVFWRNVEYFLYKKHFCPYIWRNFGCIFHFGLST